MSSQRQLVQTINQFLKVYYLDLIIIVIGTIIRILIINIPEMSSGGSNLKIYNYFGTIVASGGDPYRAPEDGAINPSYADMPPINFVLFGLLLTIYPSWITLRLFFIFIEIGSIFLLGRVTKDDQLNRLCQTLYTFSPLFLQALVVQSDDKTIVIFLTLLLLQMLKNEEPLFRDKMKIISILSLLAGYKFTGFLIFIPVLHLVSESNKEAMFYILIFIIVNILLFIPWFPSNLILFQYRFDRSNYGPMHHSIFQIFRLV
ncbi:MAG: hypothetical protein ACFFAE_22970, partial [Candidatus Hodarchaeota archaeon]